MTPAEALSMAIFAINTIVEPDASSDRDVERLMEYADEATSILVQLRDTAKGLEQALPDTPRDAGLEEDLRIIRKNNDDEE